MVRVAFTLIVFTALTAQTAAAQSYIEQYKRAAELMQRLNAQQMSIQSRGERTNRTQRGESKHDQVFSQGFVTTEQTKPAPQPGEHAPAGRPLDLEE